MTNLNPITEYYNLIENTNIKFLTELSSIQEKHNQLFKEKKLIEYLAIKHDAYNGFNILFIHKLPKYIEDEINILLYQFKNKEKI